MNLPKPQLRGRFHQVAFFVSIPFGVALVALASGAEARAVAAVFAVSLTGVYGTSALYHRGNWSPRAHRIMQGLDHAMIFVLIAGTYTPITLVALRPAWGITLLSLAWTGAVAGITLTVLRHRPGARRVKSALYIVLGWLCVVALPQMLARLTPLTLALLLAGGILYTVGAIVLATNRPNPSPRVFGYHEVWHAFVVGAGLCHYGAILAVVR